MIVVVVIAVVVEVVVVLVGRAFSGFSMSNGGLSGLSGRWGGPRGGGGGTRPVVLEGGLPGCLSGTGAWSLGLGAEEECVEGVLMVDDFSSAVRLGARVRGGVGSAVGCLGP